MPNCGKLLKPKLLTLRGNAVEGQVNSLGYSKNALDITMDNPQPSSYGTCAMEKVQRLNGSGFFTELKI